MTAADHLEQARKYASWADENWQGNDMEGARTAANIGRLHMDLHRELILREHFDNRDDWRPLVVPVPLEEYRPSGLARFKSKAPADAPAEADLHDPTTPEEA